MGIAGIEIGDYSGIASGVHIYSLSHHYRDTENKENKKRYVFAPRISDEDQFMISSPIYIGKNCAIGSGAIVMPGSVVLESTWIAQRSVVKGVVPADSLWSNGRRESISQYEIPEGL